MAVSFQCMTKFTTNKKKNEKKIKKKIKETVWELIAQFLIIIIIRQYLVGLIKRFKSVIKYWESNHEY